MEKLINSQNSNVGKICQNCGEAIDPRATICLNCGAQLQEIHASKIKNNPSTNTLAVYAKRFNPIRIFLIFIVNGIMGMGGILIFASISQLLKNPTYSPEPIVIAKVALLGFFIGGIYGIFTKV